MVTLPVAKLPRHPRQPLPTKQCPELSEALKRMPLEELSAEKAQDFLIT